MPSSSESWRREAALVGWFDLPDPKTGLHPNTIGKPVWEPKMLDGVDDQTRRRGVCLDHVQAFTQVSPNRSTTTPKLVSSRHI